MNLQQVTESIAADLKVMIDAILSDDTVGNNTKTGFNTLSNNKLSDKADVLVSVSGGSVVMDILFDNYINYIEQGRKPRTGKQPPIDALRDWALERNIPTDNSTLFLISRAIWRDGFEGRPVLATLEEEIARRMDGEWGDLLADAAMQEIEKLFE